ncbi:hypothetical protein AAAC51_06975 [Priestia megaterium]
MSTSKTKQGDKVVFKYPNNGRQYDIEKVAEHLQFNEVYTVKHVNQYQSSSEVILEEFPTIPFNTVHFLNLEDHLEGVTYLQQEYLVKFSISPRIECNVNVYRENSKELSSKEIIEDAIKLVKHEKLPIDEKHIYKVEIVQRTVEND